jgi:hypothetical protein
VFTVDLIPASLVWLLLLSDRTTPFLARPPIWKDNESLRLLRLVERHLMPEAFYRLKAKAKNIERHDKSAAATGETNAGREYGHNCSRDGTGGCDSRKRLS